MTSEEPRPDGPTELVEDAEGELVERLSGGTATLLLAWLIGVGAMSTLLAAWLFVWIATGERLGVEALIGGFGFYTGLAGAAGPCILWLTGRAQDHSLPWFLVASAKIAMVMIVMVLGVVLLATLVMAGTLPGPGALLAAGLMIAFALVLSSTWAVATWAADRWIARARAAP